MKKTYLLALLVIIAIIGMVVLVYRSAQKGRPVHKTPSPKSDIVAYIPIGAKVTIKERLKDWALIEFTKTANSGPTIIRGYCQTKNLEM